MTTLLDRCIGTFVGEHIGDSLGAQYETSGPKAIALDLDARGGPTFYDYPNTRMEKPEEHILPAGMPTDDSEQTACLALSLIACNGLDTEHFYNLLRSNVIDEKSVLWSGKSIGAGGTTKNALSGDPKRMALARNNTIGTNGSLMRAAPMGLWWATRILNLEDEDIRIAQVNEAEAMVFAMSDVTHAHQHSKDACWLYTIVLANLLAGNEPDTALDNAEYTDPSLAKSKLAQRVFLSVYDRDLIPYDPGAFPARGTAEFSLYVALYCLKHATSFAHGIEMAIRVGGDTDTYAAIAGGLLGAHYGYDAIPKAWRDTILGHDVMVDLATQMYNRFGPAVT